MQLLDVAPHGATRNLMLINQWHLAETELSKQLEMKKEEIVIFSKNLEAEKTENLLYAMLPKRISLRTIKESS